MGDCSKSADCPWTANRPRHIHACHDLRQLGEPCSYCGQNLWIILFGGPLPARIQCQACGAGFNLTQRLREAARDLPIAKGHRWAP